MSVAAKLQAQADGLRAEADELAEMWAATMTDAKRATIAALREDADRLEHALASGWADRADAMLRETMDEVAP